MITKVTIVTRK